MRLTSCWLGLFSVVLLGSLQPSIAQEVPRLVADLRPTELERIDTNIGLDFHRLGDHLVVAAHPNFEPEVHSIHRVTGEIRQVPGPCGREFERSMGTAAGEMFLSADCGDRYVIWSTDGVRGPRVVLDGREGIALVGHVPDTPFFVFSAREGPRSHVIEYWATDGTRRGAVRLAAVEFGSDSLSAVVAAQSRLFFSTDRNEIWTTDGSPEGTRRIFETTLFIDHLVAVGKRAFFLTRSSSAPTAVWTSDGSDTGTIQLTPAGLQADFGSPVGDDVRTYFPAQRQGRQELWMTDGTREGTAVAVPLESTRPLSFGFDLKVLQGRAFFVEQRDSAFTLWTTDGTAAGTRRIGVNQASALRRLGPDRLLGLGRMQTGESAVWLISATNSELELLATFAGPRSIGWVGAEGGDLLAFSLDSLLVRVPQLGVTDGSPEGTRLLPGTYPSVEGADFGLRDGKPLFRAEAFPLVVHHLRFDDSRRLVGGAFWAAPLDDEPTTLAELPFLFPRGSRPRTACALGDGVALEAAADAIDPHQVWHVEEGRAVQLTDFREFVDHNLETALTCSASGVLLQARRNGLVADLHLSDGRAGAASLVGTMVLGPSIVERAGEIYFTGSGSTWRTRFSEDRIERVPGIDFQAGLLVPLADAELLVFGDDGTIQRRNANGGLSIWGSAPGAAAASLLPSGLVFLDENGLSVTSGPSAPTRLLSGDLSVDSTALYSGSHRAFVLGDRSDQGLFLWSTDGTVAGTRDEGLFSKFNFTAPAAVTNNRLVFANDTPEAGVELYVSDGTTDGTGLLADLLPGSFGSFPSRFLASGGRVYFSANDGRHGTELWVTDGTFAGTTRLTDLFAGAGSSYPRPLGNSDTEIFFAATDGNLGSELWRLPLGAQGAPVDSGPAFVDSLPPFSASWLTAPVLPGFRFQVRIETGERGLSGRIESACLPETVCLSGAVVGRPEVFLRVVGPRPNGFLWPTLVKFTTAPVDIWIEQLGTGEIRHYFLAGARPGFDELPARFDRLGFRPIRSAAASAQNAAAEPTPEPAIGPPPPSDTWFETPEVPGFRFMVRITTGPGQGPPVRKETACIAETLCVSGALPGRSEVFLRVVGPRPNGFLWPTLARFTTSTVEVWIDQKATGNVQYYLLPGAEPDSDDLTGLFDRLGFRP
jgi:ELWxxDGT repeat protein